MVALALVGCMAEDLTLAGSVASVDSAVTSSTAGCLATSAMAFDDLEGDAVAAALAEAVEGTWLGEVVADELHPARLTFAASQEIRVAGTGDGCVPTYEIGFAAEFVTDDGWMETLFTGSAFASEESDSSFAVDVDSSTLRGSLAVEGDVLEVDSMLDGGAWVGAMRWRDATGIWAEFSLAAPSL